MTKFKNSNVIKKIKNKKTQNLTKLKKYKCEGKKTKTQNVTKLKNSKLDKTQKLKTWQNLKIEMAMKNKNSKCDKS